MANHIFISHATKDDPFVAGLRQDLELRGLTVWADSRNLRGGDQLTPKIEQAISQARAVLVVVSPHSRMVMPLNRGQRGKFCTT